MSDDRDTEEMIKPKVRRAWVKRERQDLRPTRAEAFISALAEEAIVSAAEQGKRARLRHVIRTWLMRVLELAREEQHHIVDRLVRRVIELTRRERDGGGSRNDRAPTPPAGGGDPADGQQD